MSSVVITRKAGVVDPENGGVRQGFRAMQVLAGCRLGVRVNGASKAGVHGSRFPVAAPDQGSLKPPSDFLIRHRPACWPASATGPNQLETARFTSAMLPGPTSDNPGHSKCLSWSAFPYFVRPEAVKLAALSQPLLCTVVRLRQIHGKA